MNDLWQPYGTFSPLNLIPIIDNLGEVYSYLREDAMCSTKN